MDIRGERGAQCRYIPKFSDSEQHFPAKKHGSPKPVDRSKIAQKTQSEAAKNFLPNESKTAQLDGKTAGLATQTQLS